MNLTQELLKLRWSVEYPRLQALMKEDGKTYRSLAFFFGGASILLTFFYPALLIISLPLIFILFLSKGQKEKPSRFAVPH